VELATPWGIRLRRLDRRAERSREAYEAGVTVVAPSVEARYDEMVRFLRERGLDEEEVRWGSIPHSALAYIAERVPEYLPVDRPIRALHIGNFVGVSLCFVSLLIRDKHPQSVVVSIDPNITHRRVENPQAHALALLHHYNLLEHSVIIPGYTLEWAIGDAASEAGLACEMVLSSLNRLGVRAFDLVLIDGNHDGSYLSRELELLRGLITEGSIVVFDDVGGDWPRVAEVFTRALETDQFESVGTDGRVGIVKVASRPSRV
jgi:hypothetical protein